MLDIRDGWSIAMESGYGGLVDRSPFKARIARVIERLAIRRARVVITCTPGLKQYLEYISGCEVLLITNGVSDEDMSVANKLLKEKKNDRANEDELVFLCAGKFSEYGIDKAEFIISKIVERFPSRFFVVRLVGSDPLINNWVGDYVRYVSSGFGRVEMLGRVDKDGLYRILSEADLAISLIRDPNYEFGTKVFDYIAMSVPVFNYFDSENNFTRFFNRYLDVGFGCDKDIVSISRLDAINKYRDKLI